MQNRRQIRKNKQKLQKDKKQVKKTVFQTIVAFFLLVFVWSVSISNRPEVQAFCDKIKHYLTYTVDVRSVFRPLIETNVPEGNENAH